MQTGTVEAICVSGTKGQRKSLVECAVFTAGRGIEGDGHAGPWHRQVSLLSAGDIERMKASLGQIRPGDFAENLVVAGLDLSSLGLGSRLRLGRDVVLRVTQIGKVCHTRCRVFELTGDCIMPRHGLFARVEEGGLVRVGEPVAVTEAVMRDRLQAVVLTISDRCSRREALDTAGPAVARRLMDHLGAHLYQAEILPDEEQTITERLRHYCDGHCIDLVVTVGGTGFSPRDVTPEATRAVVERPTPGLDEAMRSASLAATPHAMLSRGFSGIRGSTLIVNLPGSRVAADENLAVILPALEHGLRKLRGDASDCARPPAAG